MKVSKQGRLHSPIANPTHFILFLSLNLPNPISPSNLASNFHLYLTAIDCSSRNEGRRKTGNLRCRFSRVRFLEGLLGPRSQGHGTGAGMDREGLFRSCFSIVCGKLLIHLLNWAKSKARLEQLSWAFAHKAVRDWFASCSWHHLSGPQRP